MSTSRPRLRHPASSPFKADPEPVIEEFFVDELVSHDSYGLGRIVSVDAGAVMVDFRPEIRRIPSPFHRLSKL